MFAIFTAKIGCLFSNSAHTKQNEKTLVFKIAYNLLAVVVNTVGFYYRYKVFDLGDENLDQSVNEVINTILNYAYAQMAVVIMKLVADLLVVCFLVHLG